MLLCHGFFFALFKLSILPWFYTCFYNDRSLLSKYLFNLSIYSSKFVFFVSSPQLDTSTFLQHCWSTVPDNVGSVFCSYSYFEFITYFMLFCNLSINSKSYFLCNASLFSISFIFYYKFYRVFFDFYFYFSFSFSFYLTATTSFYDLRFGLSRILCRFSNRS